MYYYFYFVFSQIFNLLLISLYLIYSVKKKEVNIYYIITTKSENPSNFHQKSVKFRTKIRNMMYVQVCEGHWCASQVFLLSVQYLDRVLSSLGTSSNYFMLKVFFWEFIDSS